MKKNRKAALGAALFAALFLILFAVWSANRPAAQAGSKEITVQVLHSDGSEKTFTYQTDAEYLGEVLLAEGLIAGSESEYGLFVDTVDGETADYSVNRSYWLLSCNGEASETGVSSVVIYDGDCYTWAYTIG